MYRVGPVFMLTIMATLILIACQPLQTPIASAPEYAHPEALASTERLCGSVNVASSRTNYLNRLGWFSQLRSVFEQFWVNDPHGRARDPESFGTP